jgi:hypothetical protein
MIFMAFIGVLTCSALSHGHSSSSYSDDEFQSVNPTFEITSKIVTGQSTFPCAPTSTDPTSQPWPNTQTEPALAVGFNPVDNRFPLIAISYIEDRYNTGGGGNALYMIVSVDGGKTFGEPIAYPTVSCFGTTYERDTDPNLTITSNGDIYTASVPYNIENNEFSNLAIGNYNIRKNKFTYVQYIDPEDLGAPPLFGTNDFESIFADPQDPSGKTLYVIWDFVIYPSQDFSLGESILRMSKTTDGFHWSAPSDIYRFPQSVVDQFGGNVGAQYGGLTLLNNPGKPYSKLLNTFSLTVNADNPPPPFAQQIFYYSTLSCDQGETWSNPIPLDNTLNNVIGQVVDPQNYSTRIRSGGGGTIVDRERNILYSITQEHSLAYDGIPTQILLYISTDDAASWNLIGPVNTDLSTQAFMPASCLIDQGRIAISYYDFRNHTGIDPNGVLETDRWMDIYYYNKETQTLTFEKELRLTEESFNYRNAPTLGESLVSPAGLFLGDYVGQQFFERRIYHVFPIVPQDSGPNSAHLQFSLIRQIHPIPGNQ